MKLRNCFLLAALVSIPLVILGCTAKELSTAQTTHDQAQTALTTAQPAVAALQSTVAAQQAKVDALQASIAATTQPSATDTSNLASAQKTLAAETAAYNDVLKANQTLQTALDASNATIGQLKNNNTAGAIAAATGPLAAIPVVGQYATLIGTIVAAGYGVYQQIQATKANKTTQATVASVNDNADAATHADIVASLPAEARTQYVAAANALGIQIPTSTATAAVVPVPVPVAAPSAVAAPITKAA